MFKQSSRYYDALYADKDYGSHTGRLVGIFEKHAPRAQSLLDVACGTGRHLDHLRRRYRVEGLDLDAGMLAVARERLGDVPLHQADMVDFDLGRSFDVVICLFSSVAYVRTLANLNRAVARMAAHVAPRGLLVLEPWFTPETFWTDTITANFVDEPELKIAWMYTSRREDRLSVLDIHYLVGTPERVQRFEERHELGLFSHEEYMAALAAPGLLPWRDPDGLFGRGLYLALAP